MPVSFHVGPFAATILLGLIAALCPTCAEAEDEPLATFVMAGQSNMVGRRCRVDELPERLRQPSRNVLFFDAKAKGWIPLEAGKTEPEGFGPEISFGPKMAEAMNRPVGIIKFSKGGTNLAGDWNPARSKSLYSELLAQVEAARGTRKLAIVGMLWQQGGADARSESAAQAYAENLTQLVKRARKDFASAEMIFVAGRATPQDEKVKPYWKTVRQAQQNLSIERYAWIDCDGLPLVSDKVHFNTKGMVELGELQAAAIARLLEKPAKEASPPAKPTRTTKSGVWSIFRP